MALIDIVNSVNCGAGDVLGTGTKNCKEDIKRVTTLGLVERGYKFADGDIDTIAGIHALQQAGKLIILQGVVEVTDNTADDNIVTRAGSGEKVVAGQNPYEYVFTFDNGLNFHKALHHLNSYRQYDLILFDSKGDVFFTQTKAGEYKAFTLGMFQSGKYMMSNGTDAASQSVSLQMINRLEFDERVSWIVSDNLDYNAEEDLDGYNDVTLTALAPSDGDAFVKVTLYTTADNHKVIIEGLDENDFVVAVNGSPLTLSSVAYNSSDQTYTINTVQTITTGQNVQVYMFDTANNAYIINVDGILYKSNISSTVAVA